MDRSSRLDRWIIGTSLTLLVALSWIYLVLVAEGMKAMTGNGGSARYMWLMPMGKWDLYNFTLGFAMWVIMMVGMMIPSATPTILLYAKIRRRVQARSKVPWLTATFATGYLAVWAAFSFAATGLQYLLTELRLYSDLMETDSALLSGLILTSAGIYQLTVWKSACLAHCQSPISFLTRHWRDGAAGAWRMGLSHGWYCLGCCWLMMLVLFAVGVMNLLWIAALSVFVLLEKLLIARKMVSRVTGFALILLGALRTIQIV